MTIDFLVGMIITLIGTIICVFLSILNEVKDKERKRENECSKGRNDKGI